MLEKSEPEIGFDFYFLIVNIIGFFWVHNALFDFFSQIFMKTFDNAFRSIKPDIELVEIIRDFMNWNICFSMFLKVTDSFY